MVEFPAQVSSWTSISSSQTLQLMNAYTTAWFAYFGGLTSAQFQALPMNQPFNTDPTQMSFGQLLIYGLLN